MSNAQQLSHIQIHEKYRKEFPALRHKLLIQISGNMINTDDLKNITKMSKGNLRKQLKKAQQCDLKMEKLWMLSTALAIDADEEYDVIRTLGRTLHSSQEDE